MTARLVCDSPAAETIAGRGIDSGRPADCTEAKIRLRGLLQRFQALQVLRSDEADA